MSAATSVMFAACTVTPTHPPACGSAARPVAPACRRALVRATPPARLSVARRPWPAAAGSSGGAITAVGPDYAVLQQHRVLSAASGEEVALPSLWQATPGTRCVVAFLTHFGDLSSTELAQKLMAVLPELQASGVGLLAVGLGEPAKARKFAQLLGFPLDRLYADPTGELYTALGFSPGFAPEAPVSPYAKLLPMLAGIGSPGTLQEVVRGYLGDRAAKPVFASPGADGGGNLFDVLGRGYQRPFELATLRLYNMGLVLSNWKELAPAEERLLTQQGGCIAFDGQATTYRHADSGILKYADVDAMVRAVLPAGAPTEAPAQTLRTLF